MGHSRHNGPGCSNYWSFTFTNHLRKLLNLIASVCWAETSSIRPGDCFPGVTFACFCPLSATFFHCYFLFRHPSLCLPEGGITPWQSVAKGVSTHKDTQRHYKGSLCLTHTPPLKPAHTHTNSDTQKHTYPAGDVKSSINVMVLQWGTVHSTVPTLY